MKCLELREDLKNGMSIEEGLIKHGLSFEDAVYLLQFKQDTDKHPKTVMVHKKKKRFNYVKSHEEYIMQRGDTYCVRKTIKKKTRMFGTYNSLEDAVRMRDALKLDGWHQTHVDRLCEELGIVRRKGHPASKVRYH